MTMTFESARLDALVESARLLQAAPDVDQLVLHLLRSSMAHVLAPRGFIALADGGSMKVMHARGLPQVKAGSDYLEEQMRAAGIDSILPIGTAAAPIGYLGIGAPASGSLQAEQQQFLSALIGISSGAIENVRYSAEVRRLNMNLDRKVQELRTLLELVRSFTAVVDAEEVARLLGLTLAGQLAVGRYAIVAWKEGHPPVTRAKSVKLPSMDELRELADTETIPALTSTIDHACGELLRGQKIEAIIPIRTGEVTLGLVLLGSRAAGPYTDDALDYTRGLVDQAAVALENAWHFRETLEKKKIEKELELAADIQRRLLPSTIPAAPAIDVAATTRPARHVGGDYYDVIRLGDGQILYCVADVSGKGIAASLLMSNFQASLRAFASSGVSLADTVTRMNTLMHASTAANKYVTAIFARVDPATGKCGVVNAGHNDGVIFRADGSVERLKAAGLAVGLFPGRTYAESEWRLEVGDVLTLYSDGVTEANDPDENEFEIERLVDVLAANAARPAAEIVESIFAAVDAFAATAPQYDDITVLVLRRTA